MIISRKRYEREMARMLDRAEENRRAIGRLEDLHFKLKEYCTEVIESRIFEIEKRIEEEKLKADDDSIVLCKDCKFGTERPDEYIACDADLRRTDIHSPDWFCAGGKRRTE